MVLRLKTWESRSPPNPPALRPHPRPSRPLGSLTFEEGFVTENDRKVVVTSARPQDRRRDGRCPVGNVSSRDPWAGLLLRMALKREKCDPPCRRTFGPSRSGRR